MLYNYITCSLYFNQLLYNITRRQLSIYCESTFILTVHGLIKKKN